MVDIDAHGPEDDVEANARMASGIVAELTKMGLPFRVEDSDGRGGIHIWILFGRRAPQAWAFRFGQYLVRDHVGCGLVKAPEAFPKVSQHSGMGCGNWVRLPGLHHKREHWSRIWSTDEGRWLDALEGIGSLLAFRGDPTIDLTRLIPADFVPATRKANVAVNRPRPASLPAAVTAFAAQVDGEQGDVARARSAIAWLGVDAFDHHDEWIRLGMALTSLGDAGLELWDDASMPSEKYPGFTELEARWSTLREADGPHDIGIGSLYHRAVEAGWDGRYSVKTATAGPRRHRSNALDDPSEVVTPAMSDGWDEEFDRQIETLESRPEMMARLAAELGLTAAGLEVVTRSVSFGLRPTNRGKLPDGSVGALGPAWTYRESDGSGRTIGIRRLFAGPGAVMSERGSGSRSTKRPDRPDRVTRISRRGLLVNLAEASVDLGQIYLVRGLSDFAAVASFRLPCVGLPGESSDPKAGLGDLARLLAGDDRPLLIPYRKGSADPWADAHGPARGLDRELGEGIQAKSFPSRFFSLGQYFATARTATLEGVER